MNTLWRKGRASIREKFKRSMRKKKRPAYTTVQTIVYHLEVKGAAKRVKKIGNAHIFEPLITPEAAYRRVIDDLISVLGGSIRPLLDYLVDNRKLTAEDLRYLQRGMSAKADVSVASTNQEEGSAKKQRVDLDAGQKQRKKAA
ncbi:MAG: BlaI/MecI/CopY family transcriptional regulator [Pyrinomonadaceae bacterium]